MKKEVQLSLFFIIFCLTSCSFLMTKDIYYPESTNKVAVKKSNWIERGKIEISGPIPTKTTITTAALFAFMPTNINGNNFWLSINKSTGFVTLFNNNLEIKKYNLKKINNIQEGRFEISLKQKKALWYAPDEYFTNRKLAIPENNSRARFLKAALGEHVLYLSNNIAIHDSIVEIKELPSLIIPSKKLKEIYKLLKVGATVVIE